MCSSAHYWQFVICHHPFFLLKKQRRQKPSCNVRAIVFYMYITAQTEFSIKQGDGGFTGHSADAHKVSCNYAQYTTQLCISVRTLATLSPVCQMLFIFSFTQRSFHFQRDAHTGQVHTLFVRVVKNETVSCSAGFQSLFWSAPPNSPHAVTHNNFPYQPEPRPCAECWQETVFLTKPSVLSRRVWCVLVKIDFVIFTGVFINESVGKKILFMSNLIQFSHYSCPVCFCSLTFLSYFFLHVLTVPLIC